jgi:ABC-type dipeptide/oligopeptide/nickel transport system permease component
MNDDTYEEVVTFKLSRLSVYMALCTVFVVLVGLTVALIVFTPLKYYIPGYGSHAERREIMNLKIKADSLEQQMKYKEQYWENVKNVLSGDISIKLDTTQLEVPNLEKTKE